MELTLNDITFYLAAMERGGVVYILTNVTHTVLYTGVTSNLQSRIYEHKEKVYLNSFSAKYNCNILVYFEIHASIEEAIEAEKKIKKLSRANKVKLIERSNRNWTDLFEEVKNW